MTPEEEQKQVKERAQALFRENREELAKEYEKRFGNYLCIDNARELFPDYSKSKEARALNATAVHQPAGFLVQDVWEKKLKEGAKDEQKKPIVFVVGGTGSGKSTVINGDPRLKESSLMVVESVKSLDNKVQQALNANHKVMVYYVHRPIEEAAKATAQRAIKDGRTVPVESFVEGHVYSQKQILSFADKYEDNKNVTVKVIDNSVGFEMRVGSLKKVQDNLYKTEEIDKLKEVSHGIIREEFRKAKKQGEPVSREVIRGTFGRISRNNGKRREQALSGRGQEARYQDRQRIIDQSEKKKTSLKPEL